MKSTCPPLQVIFVGLESNQHGQAASHEQASSSCPVIFHGVLPSVFSDARPVEPVKRRLAASIGTRAMNNRVVLMGREEYARPVIETSQFDFLKPQYGLRRRGRQIDARYDQRVRQSARRASPCKWLRHERAILSTGS